ncbi:MAG TPA: NADH-quinone oxidoreductase subunit M [Acidimicrobiales bacterium]|nr:NADH-quinone oxidoreductase subunit M [Acidimicrobiales bacterium]
MLTAAIFVPVAGAIILLLVPRLSERATRRLSLGLAAVPLVLLVAAWARFDGGSGFDLVESVPWIPSLGVAYTVGVDGVSLPLAAMSALLFVVALAYPADRRGRPRQYAAAFLFLEGASLGVFLALDLFLFYVFFDVSLVGMYFLIAVWGHGDAQRSALKFFLYTLAGSLAMLLAILGLYLSSEPRTFDMAELIRQQPLGANGLRSVLVFLGFAVGLGIKTPIVPFHTWLPPAHVDAPAPASTILAGVLLKMGTYGFVRIVLSMMPDAFQRFSTVVGVVAVVSIVYGALVALAQTDLKRMIAYSSVNHMGYVMLGLAAAAAASSGDADARSLALSGATLEMVAHGLITGALFLLAGSVWARGETYDMDSFGGLAARAPAMTGAATLAAFASLGLPGLAGFVAEFQIFAGTFAVQPVLAAVGLLGIVLTAAFFLRMLQRVFLGPLPERWVSWPDLGRTEVLALAPLLALTVAIGVAPAWVLDVIETTASALVGP